MLWNLRYRPTAEINRKIMKAFWFIKCFTNFSYLGKLNLMTNFTKKVYEITKNIPRGKVATYGQVAKLAGNPKAARAVGLLMKKNPDLSIIPCHRVVASDGKLTGYSAGGIGVKRKLLIEEGVAFNGTKVDLSQSLWRS